MTESIKLVRARGAVSLPSTFAVQPQTLKWVVIDSWRRLER